jgi:hypothetical protein
MADTQDKKPAQLALRIPALLLLAMVLLVVIAVLAMKFG